MLSLSVIMPRVYRKSKRPLLLHNDVTVMLISTSCDLTELYILLINGPMNDRAISDRCVCVCVEPVKVHVHTIASQTRFVVSQRPTNRNGAKATKAKLNKRFREREREREKKKECFGTCIRSFI